MDVTNSNAVAGDKFARLATVLGSLDRSTQPGHAALADPSAAWSLNRGGIFKAGRNADDSSDEGEPDEHGRQEVLPGSFVDDEDEGERELPSTSFCRALDREAEYDDIDDMASRSLGRAGACSEPKPHKGTEVLEGNAYELLSSVQAPQAACATGPESVDVDMSAPAGEPRATAPVAASDAGPSSARQAGARSSLAGRAGTHIAGSKGVCMQVHAASGVEAVEGQPHSQPDAAEDKKPEKRLRFHEPVTWRPSEQAAASTSGEPSTTTGTSQQQVQQQTGSALAGRPGCSGQQSGRSGTARQRRSYVPDHVKNPQKYTCYVLDEPVTVGGGDSGAGDQRQLEKAAREAQAVAIARDQASHAADSAEGQAVLPAFGSGIEFRSRASRLGEDTQPANGKADGHDKPSGGHSMKTRAAVLFEEDANEAGEGMDLDEPAAEEITAAAAQASAVPSAGSRPQRKRQYRGRAASDGD